VTALRSVVYEAPGWGLGEVVFRGDVPVHHEMPHDEAAPTGDAAATAAQRALIARLRAYFAGDRASFADVDLGPTLEWAGVTPFEERCLRELQRIPYGETVSYGELASRAGRERAHRAAGSVCARGTLSLVVPYHRVIRSDGSIGEWGPEGNAYKLRLLRHEGLHL
jgi:methylated-DNA-[protein]-cysteine S-methyltransferase